MTDTFQRLEAISVQEQDKTPPKSVTWSDIQSFCLHINLPTKRLSFNLKRKTNKVNIFKIKFINGIANLQMKIQRN